MTRTEIIAAVCVERQKHDDAIALRKVALKLWEMGEYTFTDYSRFCERNGLLPY